MAKPARARERSVLPAYVSTRAQRRRSQRVGSSAVGTSKGESKLALGRAEADDGVGVGGQVHGALGAGLAAVVATAAVAVVAAAVDAEAAFGHARRAGAVLQAQLVGVAAGGAGLGHAQTGKEADADGVL